MDSRALLDELPRLRRYARALVGERAAADDLVQDTLERAWAKAHQWRAGSSLRNWLFAIMHSVRVDQWRRGELPMTTFDEQSMDTPTRATQEDGLALNDLATALGALPEEQRSVLLLVGLEEMSYAEVAATLAIPIGTVMSRLARGRERLRQLLAEPDAPTRLRVVR